MSRMFPPPPKAARRARPTPLSTGAGGQQDSVRDRPDRISELSSDLLGTILFFLPLKEAGRTTTLSKRWSDVFKYAPIQLDDEMLTVRRRGRRLSEAEIDAERAAVITRIVKRHRGPIRRVRLVRTRFQGDVGLDHGGVGLEPGLFAGQNVEELILHSAHSVQFFPAGDLRSLELVGCGWFSAPPPPATLSHIKALTLRGVTISEPELHALMDQCSELESLTLSSYHVSGHARVLEQVDIARFEVRSNSLRVLSLELHSLEKVVLLDAPNLESLHCVPIFWSWRGVCNVVLINAPKLRILGALSNSFHLMFCIAHMMHGVDLPVTRPPFYSLKILSVRVDLWSLLDIKRALLLLKYFPALEELNIKVYNHVNKYPSFTMDLYASFLEVACSVGCLRNSLKVVNMSCFCGCDPELQFAKILLGSAGVLKVMRIFTNKTGQTAWIRTQRRRLDFQRKASLDAEVVFAGNPIELDEVGDTVLNSGR